MLQRNIFPTLKNGWRNIPFCPDLGYNHDHGKTTLVFNWFQTFEIWTVSVSETTNVRISGSRNSGDHCTMR